MRRNKIVYRISVEDVQEVAKLEIERELTAEEIGAIEDTIAENIDWYIAIANAIHEHKIRKNQNL